MRNRNPRLTPERAFVATIGVLLAGLVAVPLKLGASPAGLASAMASSLAAPSTATASPTTAAAAAAARQLAPAADIAIAPPPAVFEAPAPSPAPPPPQLAGRVAASGDDRLFAVVIGIDDYPGRSSDLRSAVADARDMEAALAQFDVPDANVVALHDGQASAATILDAVDWLVAVAPREATVVFFYAGHVRKVGPTTEAIVAADGAVVPDNTLAEHLAPLAAQDAWLVMASCFGGGFTEAVAPGRILTAAADANSLAYENPAFGRSYLAEFLVRQAMLEHRAGATAQAAFAYAQAALAAQYPDRKLTEIDESTHPISLDGRPPETATLDPPSPPATEPPAPPPSATPTTAPPAPGCHNLLGLFCD